MYVKNNEWIPVQIDIVNYIFNFPLLFFMYMFFYCENITIINFVMLPMYIFIYTWSAKFHVKKLPYLLGNQKTLKENIVNALRNYKLFL